MSDVPEAVVKAYGDLWDACALAGTAEDGKSRVTWDALTDAERLTMLNPGVRLCQSMAGVASSIAARRDREAAGK